MITRCAYVIGAMALFSLNGAIGQTTAGASLLGNESDRASPSAEQHPARREKTGPARGAAGRQSALGNSDQFTFRHPRTADLFCFETPSRAAAAAHAGCRSTAAAAPSRAGGAPVHAHWNGGRNAAECRVNPRPNNQKPRSSACRRSRLGLVFALGRRAGDDAREE